MKKVLLCLMVLISACKVSPPPPDQAVGKLGPNPYIEVDGSALASPSELQNYNEHDIASAETLYGGQAVEVFGEKARDGAVIFHTKQFSRAKYHALFSSVSYEFSRIFDEGEYSEEDIQYILNERVLEKDFEGDLAAIDKKSLKKITVINQEKLQNKYGVSDKKVGVLIKAKTPKNLYNAKKKF